MKTAQEVAQKKLLSKRMPFQEKYEVGLLPFVSCNICGNGILSQKYKSVSDVKLSFIGFKYIEGTRYMLVKEKTESTAFIYVDEVLCREYCQCASHLRALAPVGTLFNLEKSFVDNRGMYHLPISYLVPHFPIYTPYAISVDTIITGKDKRTTCMIKNIPNKLNIRQLIEILSLICYNSFDFVYLRMDFKSNCNNGYAFINFRKTKYIPIFLDAIQGKKWKNFKSEKKGDIAYARIQGLRMLQNRFRRSDILGASKDFWPVIFNEKGEEILATEWKAVKSSE